MSPMIAPHILPILFSLAASAPMHPHYPKAVSLGCAKGKAVISYFTLPYNKDQVATLEPGSSWYMGSAALRNEVPFKSGDIDIPAGNWKLNVRFNDEGVFSAVELVPMKLAGGLFGRNRPDNPDAVKAELKKAGIPALISIPLKTFAAPDQEHLEIAVMNRGYQTPEMGSEKPAGGFRQRTR